MARQSNDPAEVRSQDSGRAAAIVSALQDAADNDACCLVATHDPAVLSRFARVLTMRDGRLV